MTDPAALIASGSQPWEVITALATAGAAIAPAWAAWTSRSATQATRDLVALETERRAEEREGAKVADVQYLAFSIVKPSSGLIGTTTDSYFRLKNSGPHPATDIELEFENEPLHLNRSHVPQSLDAGDYTDLYFVFIPGASEYNGTVSWSDGRAERQSKPVPPGWVAV